MKRVMIIGGPGAGKTWLARRLSEQLALPMTSADDHVWRPDRTIREASEIDAALTAIAEGERWIIEGGNTRTYAVRPAGPSARFLPASPARVRH